MFGHLYRYPHPYDANKFIYCGQGSERDGEHRSGRSSFGRRFRRRFPGVELPQPIREQVEIASQFELNELETMWFFIYHTWWGYEGGMNLTVPGSSDYKNMSRIGAPLGGRIGGPIAGRKAVESGQIQALGRAVGRAAVESGRLASYRTPEHQRSAIAALLAFTQNPEHQRNAARAAGKKNVESGHIQALGRKWGREAAESGRLDSYRTVEHQKFAGRSGGRKTAAIPGHLSKVCRIGGRIGGRVCVEKSVGVYGLTPQQKSAAGRKGGRIGGRTTAAIPGHMTRAGSIAGRHAVETGQIAALGRAQGRKNTESGHLKNALHTRWHVKLNKPNPRCVLCSE